MKKELTARQNEIVDAALRLIAEKGMRNLTIRHLTMIMKDHSIDNYAENKDWTPPKTDEFRIPKCGELPFGLAFHCMEGLRVEDYRMVTGHPEWWLRDLKNFDSSIDPSGLPRKAGAK